MNNILSLTKILLINNFNINKIFKKDKLARKILILVLFLIISAFLFFSMYQMYYSILLFSNPETMIEAVLTITILMAVTLTLITSTTQMIQIFARSNDFDLLMSLPVKPREIIIAKILTILATNYFSIVLFVFAPAFSAIVFNIAMPSIFYLNYLLIVIFFPLFITGILGILFYYIKMIFRNFRYKNLLVILSSITFFVLYMLFFNIGMDNENMDKLLDTIISNLKYIYYPGSFAVNALTGDFKSLIIFIGLNLLVFAVFIYSFNRNYVKLNNINVSVKKHKNTEIKDSKRTNNTIELFKIEVKRYFGLSSYVLNTIIGKIMIIIFIIIFYSSINKEVEGINIPSELPVMLLMGVITFGITLTSTTSSAISLEGKKFWNVKSLPISHNSVFKSKILLEALIGTIFGLIGVILGFILFKINIITILLISILTVLLAIHNGVLGLIINLLFPKMEWDLPIRAIKQSMSVFVSMLASFAITIILIALGVLIYSYTELINLVVIGLIGTILIILITEVLILKYRGKKWYININ